MLPSFSEFTSRFRGPVLPITTPFRENGGVNYDALEKMMRYYLDSGVTSFIAAGSTGQCSVLTEEEHDNSIRVVMDVCADYKQSFVASSCTHTSTAVSNRLADINQKHCSHALILTAPYYRPHRDMSLVHYNDVARNHPDMPVIVYHDVNMTEDLSLWDEILGGNPNIMGAKFPSRNIYFAQQLMSKYKGRFAVYGGGGMLQFLAMVLLGSPGWTASFSNFAPEIELLFWKLIEERRFDAAVRIAEMEFSFFDMINKANKNKAVPGNWFSVVIELQNLAGLPQGHRREPLPNGDELDRAFLRRFLKDTQNEFDRIKKEIL